MHGKKVLKKLVAISLALLMVVNVDVVSFAAEAEDSNDGFQEIEVLSEVPEEEENSLSENIVPEEVPEEEIEEKEIEEAPEEEIEEVSEKEIEEGETEEAPEETSEEAVFQDSPVSETSEHETPENSVDSGESAEDVSTEEIDGDSETTDSNTAEASQTPATYAAARAIARTQAEAVQWVKSQVGKSLDMDGAYGAQCVDLILAYYDYFGVPRASGNGADYAWNTLPSGWQRIQGAQPQPGDILVYTGGYGHVAIYESDYSTYHQNFNGHSYVERITYRYNSLSNPYWGVIRPNFSSVPANISYGEVSVEFVEDYNAGLKGIINNPGRTTVNNVGAYIWDSTGKQIVNHSEYCGLNNSVITQRLNIVGEALSGGLQSGSTYTYQLWASANGNTVYSEKKTFTTTGPKPVTKLTAVTGLKAQPYGREKVLLTWDAKANANGYLVYVQRGGNGTYGYLGMTYNTYFLDKKAPGDTYSYYWVFPYNLDSTGKIVPGAVSNYVYARGIIPSVTYIKGESVKSGARIIWSQQKDADGYLLYGIRYGKSYGYIGMTMGETVFVDKSAPRSGFSFYWVFPYYKDSAGCITIGEISKTYAYGKKL